MLSFLSPTALEITLPIFNYRCRNFFRWESYRGICLADGVVSIESSVDDEVEELHLPIRAVMIVNFFNDSVKIWCEDGSTWLLLWDLYNDETGFAYELVELKDRSFTVPDIVPSFSKLLVVEGVKRRSRFSDAFSDPFFAFLHQ